MQILNLYEFIIIIIDFESLLAYCREGLQVILNAVQLTEWNWSIINL